MKPKEIEVLEQLLEEIYPNPLVNVLLMAQVGVEKWIENDNKLAMEHRLLEDEHVLVCIQHAIDTLEAKYHDEV